MTDPAPPRLRRAPTSHIPRTLALLARRGWTAQVVERRIPFNHVTVDLWGCIDLLAMHPERGIMGVQVCAAASHATRRTKALAEPRLATWLASGGAMAIWSWAKRGAAGERALWELREERIVLIDMQVAPGPAIPNQRQLERAERAERRAAKRPQTRLRLGPPTVSEF